MILLEETVKKKRNLCKNKQKYKQEDIPEDDRE